MYKKYEYPPPVLVSPYVPKLNASNGKDNYLLKVEA